MNKIELTYTHNESVARIILNDGGGNVIDSIMMSELQTLFAEFKNKSSLKLIVFEGAGKSFSFGASVKEHKKEFADAMLTSFHGLFLAIIDLAVPTMAKISGQCLGGGFELALACNFIFADTTARLGQPEINLGVFAPPASLMLPLKIGAARAEELLLTGRIIKTEEAKEKGILNEVYENRETMDAETDRWIEKYILPKSASSLRYAVRASRATFNETLTAKLPLLQSMYVKELMQTKDANEGINSFIEKREAVWENC